MKNKLDWFDDNWNWDVRPHGFCMSFCFPLLTGGLGK